MCKYVVIDLEMCRTQNHNYLKNEVIQIGAVLLNESFDPIDSFMTYVSPEYGYVDTFINKLTGISNNHLKEAFKFKEALELFLAWLPEDVIFVSWSENDEYQLREEITKKNININIDELFNNWEDCQEIFNDRVNTSKNYKLSEALRISNIDVDKGEHDALIDAKNTAKLYKKLMTEEEFKFNNYYINSCDVKRTLYNPFAELLANYNLVG